MAVPQTIDLVSEGLERITYFFRDSTEVKLLLQSFLEEAQELEDNLDDLLNFRSLSTAIGSQLDDIGESPSVGEKRNSRSDEDYRKAIELRLSINNSEGTADELLTILKQVTSATDVSIIEHYGTSSITFIITADMADVPSNIRETMDEMACAGVRVDEVLLSPAYSFTPLPYVGAPPSNSARLAELTSPDPEDLLRGVLSELL